MLQLGDEAVCSSAVFLLVMLATRSVTGASLLTAFLYVFMALFRFPPVPAEQAGRVLRPSGPAGGVPAVAHRGGSHDAPENTLAAIREVTCSQHTHLELCTSLCTIQLKNFKQECMIHPTERSDSSCGQEHHMR